MKRPRGATKTSPLDSSAAVKKNTRTSCATNDVTPIKTEPGIEKATPEKDSRALAKVAVLHQCLHVQTFYFPADRGGEIKNYAVFNSDGKLRVLECPMEFAEIKQGQVFDELEIDEEHSRVRSIGAVTQNGTVPNIVHTPTRSVQTARERGQLPMMLLRYMSIAKEPTLTRNSTPDKMRYYASMKVIT